MNWLFPGFLLGVSAVALPILLHFLRRRPRRTIAFPSLRFLLGPTQQTEESQRLRRLLVLLLRCAALGLLAAAFARPFFGSNRSGERQAAIVIVDNSFSLQATDRWPTLLAWAREQIADARPDDEIGVLQMAPRPTWLAPLKTRPDVARALLAKLTPGWETARVEPALRLAADTLAASDAEQRRIVVLGDHQQVSWSGFNFAQQLPPGIEAIFPALPPPPTRQAAVRPPTITRTATGFHATVSVENFGAAHNRTLRIYRDGALTPVQQQSIALTEREKQTLSVDLPAGASAETAYFRFALDEDDLKADDEAYAIWQSTAERAVMVDPPPNGSGADYLGTALAATSGLNPSITVTGLPGGPWSSRAVAVLRNDASFSGETAARLNTFLRSGGAALIFVDGSPAQGAWLAKNGIKVRPLKAGDVAYEVRDWAMDHALITAMASSRVSALLGWKFKRAWALPADALEPLALWGDNGAAIGETIGSAGRMLICGFPPDRRSSEWPVRESFVPFVHRAVSYLLGGPTGTPDKPARIGEVLVLPAETGSWRGLAGPATAVAPAGAGRSIVAALPGVYEFAYGTDRKLFAVNVAAEESDPTPWNDGTPWQKLASDALLYRAPTTKAPLAAIEAEQRTPLWWWLLGALALVMLAELGLANRTTR